MADVPKPKPLDYAPPTVTLRDRFGRYLPTREQFGNFLKTLVWVAPLSLLIWVYAEREQSVTLPGVTVPIEVRTTDHNRQITLRRPPDKLIVVELSGPRAKLDHVRELLKPTSDGGPITIYVDPQIGLGGQELLTVSQINNHPVFANNGITVKSAQPPYLFVDIDQYEEREVPVKAPPEVANLLTEQTRFVPDTVKLRAPSQLFKAAEANHPLVAYADLAKREELKNRTGAQRLENVPVYWIHRENVMLTPGTVTANLDIKLRDVEYTIASVPIWLEAPAGFNDRFTVQYTPTINNLVVTGPAEQIDLIKKGEIKPKARFEVTSLDPTDRALRRRLQFELPPGVSLTAETAGRIEWEFRLVARER